MGDSEETPKTRTPGDLEPLVASESLPVLVGSESRSAYQWAARLAPQGQVIPYKNAMLWLEGESFGSKDEFLAKVERIIKFQEEDSHRPTATVSVPVVIPAEDDESTSEGEWTTKAAKPPKVKPLFVRWTKQQLAKGIVDACIREMKRVFSYTGPSLAIKTVYPQFSTTEFTYPALIGAIRDEIVKLRIPSEEGFPVGKSARYNAASSAGKGQNFNFKVQRKDSSAPNGWSAAAQIHVLWQ